MTTLRHHAEKKMDCPGWPCSSPSVTEKSRATAPAQAFAFVTPGLMAPIQIRCAQGLVNTPDVFGFCPCHGLCQCRLHTAVLQSKMVDGCSPLSTGSVLVWVSASSRGLPARLSLSHRALEHSAGGDFSSGTSSDGSALFLL